MVIIMMIIKNGHGGIEGMRIGRGNCSTWRKPAPSTILSTTNSISNPGHRGGKPTTNSVSLALDLYEFLQTAKPFMFTIFFC
jgi:hypothetical protein